MSLTSYKLPINQGRFCGGRTDARPRKLGRNFPVLAYPRKMALSAYGRERAGGSKCIHSRKLSFSWRLESMNYWWCMDCRSAVELDRHGRCASCDSEAVDPFRGGSRDSSSAAMDHVSTTGSISYS